MKKNIIKSIGFILVLLICLIILSRIVYPKNNSAEYGMHAKDANGVLAEPKDTLDVIVVGNSEAYSSIIPMEIWNDYGYTSYVCASPDQILPHSIRILHELDNKQKPKIVLLEANSAFRSTKFYEPMDQALNYTFKVYQYHDRWKTLNEKDFTSEPQNNVINHLKGYNYSKEAKAVNPESNKEAGKKEPVIPATNKLYIKMIRDYCKDRGIKFVAINSPIKKFWDHRNHVALQEFFDANEIEYLDLNMHEDEIKIDWNTETRDEGDHLNHKGALKATKFYGKYLHETGLLKSHKDDEKFKFWNESYNEYKKITL